MISVLIDLEGTLISGKAFQPIPGATELIQSLRARGFEFRIVTNNTTDTSRALFEKLNAVQIKVAIEEIVSVLDVLGLAVNPGARVMVMGAPVLSEVVSALGCQIISPSEDQKPEFVVVGGGALITNQLLSVACKAILDDKARLIGLHKNRLYVDEAGERTVGIGALISALEYATNTQAIIVGKPSEMFFKAALDSIGTSCDDIWCVSDDPYSDLVGAADLGMKTIFVTTGKYKRDECERLERQPHMVLDDLYAVQEHFAMLR